MRGSLFAVPHCSHRAAAAGAGARLRACAEHGVQFPPLIVRVQPGARADATAHAQLRVCRTPAAAPPVGRRAVAARAGPCALQALPHRLWGSGRSGQPAEKHAETATNLHLVLCRAHPEQCGCPAAVCAKTTAPGMPQEPRQPGALGLPVPACREAAPRPLTLRGQRGGP